MAAAPLGVVMRADVFIDKTEGDHVEISVVKHGLSSGPAHKYDTFEKAREVLVQFGFDQEMIDRQLKTLSKAPPSFLLKFPTVEIAEEVLRSLDFKAAVFQAA
jgi:hypothetical protein